MRLLVLLFAIAAVAGCSEPESSVTYTATLTGPEPIGESITVSLGGKAVDDERCGALPPALSGTVIQHWHCVRQYPASTWAWAYHGHRVTIGLPDYPPGPSQLVPVEPAYNGAMLQSCYVDARGETHCTVSGGSPTPAAEADGDD